MLSWLKRKFTKPNCALCNKPALEALPYYDDKGSPVVVCLKCLSYAERRAYRRRT